MNDAFSTLEKLASLQEKTAMARKMDEVFRGLSAVARNKLLNHTYKDINPSNGEHVVKKLIDHEQDIKGLRKGTENIVNRYGGKITHLDSDQLGDQIMKDLKSSPLASKAYKDAGYDINDPGVANEIKDSYKDVADTSGNYMNSVYSKMVNEGDVHHEGSLLSQIGKPPQKGSLGHRYVNELFLRHEADELRYGQQSLKNPKKSIGFEGDRAVSTQTEHGHASPKVIGRESQNVAKAPDEVYKYVRSLRGKGTGESGMYSRLGHEYGKSGRYDKNTFSKIEKQMVKANKPEQKKFLGLE